MQRIQPYRLLITFLFFLGLTGCNNNKAPSVAEYMHDLDAANAKLQEAKLDPVKAQTDRAMINASNAVAQVIDSSSLLECWHHKPISTATTDHACLDAKGYKR